MPDVESDELCMLMTKITFFLLNITKTWCTHALKNLTIHRKIVSKLPNKTERKYICTQQVQYKLNYCSKWHTQSYELSLLVKRSRTFEATFVKLCL